MKKINSLILILLSSVSVQNTNNIETAVVSWNFNSTKGTLSQKFLSIGMDASLLENLSSIPLRYLKFIQMVKHLSPAFLRIGGTASDILFFKKVSFKFELLL